MSNADQVAYWNGPTGERWVEMQESMDITLRPLGEAAIDALDLRPGHSVIDVGCGCGATSLSLASRVGPGGRVIGVDVSGPMLARASARSADPRITFVLEDAAHAELPPVDRIFSRFGVMFFSDPVAAFANLRRALPQGGRFSFVCWRSPAENEWVKIPMDAAASVLGPQAPSDPLAPGPFSFADRDRVAGLLAAAGLRDVAIEPADVPVRWTTSSDEGELREKIVRIGPAARRLADAPPEAAQRAVEAILAALRPRIGEEGWLTAAAAWIVTGAR